MKIFPHSEPITKIWIICKGKKFVSSWWWMSLQRTNKTVSQVHPSFNGLFFLSDVDQFILRVVHLFNLQLTLNIFYVFCLSSFPLIVTHLYYTSILVYFFLSAPSIQSSCYILYIHILLSKNKEHLNNRGYCPSIPFQSSSLHCFCWLVVLPCLTRLLSPPSCCCLKYRIFRIEYEEWQNTTNFLKHLLCQCMRA